MMEIGLALEVASTFDYGAVAAALDGPVTAESLGEALRGLIQERARGGNPCKNNPFAPYCNLGAPSW